MKIEDFERVFKNYKPISLGLYNYYSVLVPLVEKNGEPHILYEVRSDCLKKQPGEVCFPGGRIEEDETARECAIRETSEELNIDPSSISVLAQLDFIHTYSNFTLYPFLGKIDYEVFEDMKINQNEVKEVFLVPVSFLESAEPTIYTFDIIPDVGDDFPYERINSKSGYNWRKGKSVVPIYEFEDKVIWGLTGRITCNLMKIMNKNK